MLFIAIFAIGQQQPSQASLWNNVRFGGNLGLNFGNDFFSAVVNPSAVYEFNEYVAFGPGLHFAHHKIDNFKSTLYGASLISLINPIPEVQLSMELEQLRVQQKETINGTTRRNNFWATGLFVGAGIRTGNIIFGMRYNLIHDQDRSIYRDPWLPFVRVYF